MRGFRIYSFIFSFKEDFFYYVITYYVIPLPFQIVRVYIIKECGPQSNLNSVEFVWNFSTSIKLKTVAIAAVPFHNDISPHNLYVKKHRAARDGFMIQSLCSNCRSTFKMHIRNLTSNCKLSEKCIYVTYVCVNNRHSEAGRRILYFILSITSNIFHKPI
jgi:hypothetical protein